MNTHNTIDRYDDLPRFPAGQFDMFFFDMDQTLTRSKTEITDKHFKMLYRLSQKYPVAIVSGAVLSQMMKQIVLMNCDYLAQNGNHAITLNGEEVWRNELEQSEVDAIYKHMDKISKAYGVKMTPETVQNRGCQVSFSMVGHDADLETKEKYDPSRFKRQQMLEDFPFTHPELTVRIGGTTCLDYTSKHGTKGKNVKAWIEHFCPQNPIYVGDALFKGGNDESVIGVCETYQVMSVEDTYDFISSRL